MPIFVLLYFADVPPFLAVFGYQGVYPGEALCSCGVLDGSQIAILEHFEEGFEEFPGDLNFVLPCE